MWPSYVPSPVFSQAGSLSAWHVFVFQLPFWLFWSHYVSCYGLKDVHLPCPLISSQHVEDEQFSDAALLPADLVSNTVQEQQTAMLLDVRKKILYRRDISRHISQVFARDSGCSLLPGPGELTRTPSMHERETMQSTWPRPKFHLSACRPHSFCLMPPQQILALPTFF